MRKGELGFFEELQEDIDRLWYGAPPVIELRGWWWKRHIPHYKRMNVVLNLWIEEVWREEYPNFREQIDRLQKEEFKTMRMTNHEMDRLMGKF